MTDNILCKKGLEVGMILKDVGTGETFRLLHFDEENDYAVIISLDSNNGLPYAIDYQPFLQDFLAGGYMVNPTLPKHIAIPSMEDLNLNQIRQMEDNWQLIKPLVTSIPECFDNHFRKTFITNMRSSGCSDSKARRLLHRYWASGNNKLALAPRFDQRGKKPSVKNREKQTRS